MRLRQQFDSAHARDPEAFEGEYVVHLVHDRLPMPLRFFGHRKVFRREPGGVAGSNEFLGGLLRTGHFRVGRGRSADGADVTQIRYDDEENPLVMRSLTDEVREIAPGTFLGRGMFAIGPFRVNAFWFTVTKE